MIKGFFRFYIISMSVVARPICEFVIWYAELSSIANSLGVFFGLPEFRREYFCLSLYTTHCLSVPIRFMLHIPVYQEWINAYIPILSGDRNIGIAYSYYVDYYIVA